MEFRLKPLAGAGEDWVSLVIPYNPHSDIQSYLLRGLTTGTSYEARVRTKTRHGVSHYSDTWVFSTWSPWTTSAPVTVFSLPQRVEQAGQQGQQLVPQWSSDSFNPFPSDNSQHSLAKGKHQVSSYSTTAQQFGLTVSKTLKLDKKFKSLLSWKH